MAGLKNAWAVPRAACRTTISPRLARPLSNSSARTACRPARTRSAPIITLWRGKRSAQTPPNNTNSTTGTTPAASTMPTAVGESVMSRTANESATGIIASPVAATT